MIAATPDPALVESAAASPWVAYVVAFTRWVGTGRKLTQTGRITLAHARELVGLLGTGDVVNPVIGGQVFPIKSSEELPVLGAVVEWAKAGRLVRAGGGKLVPVQKSAPLLDRPIALWQRMFEVFGKLGPALCQPGWGESLLRHDFDDAMTNALAMIYAKDGPAPVAEVCSQVWQRIDGRYRIESEARRDTLRRCNDRDVQQALGVLAQFGAVRLEGPDEALTVSLTALGASAVDQRRAG
jgi:hypothetical protein